MTCRVLHFKVQRKVAVYLDGKHVSTINASVSGPVVDLKVSTNKIILDEGDVASVKIIQWNGGYKVLSYYTKWWTVRMNPNNPNEILVKWISPSGFYIRVQDKYRKYQNILVYVKKNTKKLKLSTDTVNVWIWKDAYVTISEINGTLGSIIRNNGNVSVFKPTSSRPNEIRIRWKQVGNSLVQMFDSAGNYQYVTVKVWDGRWGSSLADFLETILNDGSVKISSSWYENHTISRTLSSYLDGVWVANNSELDSSDKTKIQMVSETFYKKHGIWKLKEAKIKFQAVLSPNFTWENRFEKDKKYLISVSREVIHIIDILIEIDEAKEEIILKIPGITITKDAPTTLTEKLYLQGTTSWMKDGTMDYIQAFFDTLTWDQLKATVQMVANLTRDDFSKENLTNLAKDAYEETEEIFIILQNIDEIVADLDAKKRWYYTGYISVLLGLEFIPATKVAKATKTIADKWANDTLKKLIGLKDTWCNYGAIATNSVGVDIAGKGCKRLQYKHHLESPYLKKMNKIQNKNWRPRYDNWKTWKSREIYEWDSSHWGEIEVYYQQGSKWIHKHVIDPEWNIIKGAANWRTINL